MANVFDDDSSSSDDEGYTWQCAVRGCGTVNGCNDSHCIKCRSKKARITDSALAARILRRDADRRQNAERRLEEQTRQCIVSIIQDDLLRELRSEEKSLRLGLVLRSDQAFVDMSREFIEKLDRVYIAHEMKPKGPQPRNARVRMKKDCPIQ
ncbi:hypothetical protein DIPPA_62858 [Diplonema papillatum]|nr:hypothetical protein DIPPA_62858 [Diplonema papillatum]